MRKWAFLLLCFSVSVQAEVMFGIQYAATLGTIKEQYPNAVYTKLKPAWLQKDEAFILVDGTGMSGALRIAFTDSRPSWAVHSEENARAFLERTGSAVSEANIATYMRWARAQATRTDEDALEVNWVRWTPPAPVPLAKLVARYGKPVCAPDETFETVCRWPSRALAASIDSAGKAAVKLDTDFTEDERKKGLALR